MEIEIDLSAKENQKTFTLVESRGITGRKKLKNILPCLTKVNKGTKKGTFLKNFDYPKPLLFFHVLTTFFSKF